MNKCTYNYETYSYEQYEGHHNEEIISLINDLNDAESEVKRLQEEIDKIQSNCNHEYMFVTKSIYEDAYTCRKCGHNSWR